MHLVSLLGCWILAIVVACCVNQFQCRCQRFFSHRGSLEDDSFPEVQSFWNIKNNFPSKLYSNGSVPLSVLRHLLVTQMKEEEGGMKKTTVPWQHTMYLPIAFPFRVQLALLNWQCASKYAILVWHASWRDVADYLRERCLLLELLVPYGLPEKKLVKASLLQIWSESRNGGMLMCFMIQVFQADTVNVCLARWNMLVICDSPGTDVLTLGKSGVCDEICLIYLGNCLT